MQVADLQRLVFVLCYYLLPLFFAKNIKSFSTLTPSRLLNVPARVFGLIPNFSANSFLRFYYIFRAKCVVDTPNYTNFGVFCYFFHVFRVLVCKNICFSIKNIVIL